MKLQNIQPACTQTKAANQQAGSLNSSTLKPLNIEHASFAPVSSENIKAYSLTGLKNLSFGRTMAEHKSWGVNYDPKTQKSTVKIYAPSADDVFIQVAKYDKNNNLLWDVHEPAKADNKNVFEYKLTKHTTSEGYQYHSLDDEAAKKMLPPNTMYRYRISRDNGTQYFEPDLESKSQPFDTLGWSQVINPINIDAAHKSTPLIDVSQINACELHVGIFSKKHDFEGLREKAKELREKGYNTVQLMPVNSFYSGGKNYADKKQHPQGWGYDLQFTRAVQQSYGGIEEYKKTVKILHEAGLKVVQDVVFNHAAFLLFNENGKPPSEKSGFNAAGELYKVSGVPNWGPRPKFENQHIREHAIDSALYFLNDLKVDGLRLDSVHNLIPEGMPASGKNAIERMDRKFLKELMLEIQQHSPGAIVYAEYENRNGLEPSKGTNTVSVNPIDLTNKEKLLLKQDQRDISQNLNLDPDAHTNVVKSVAVKGGTDEPMGFDAVLGIDGPHFANQIILNNKFNNFLDIFHGERSPRAVTYLTGCHDYASGDFYPEEGKNRAIVRYAQAFTKLDENETRKELEKDYKRDNTNEQINPQQLKGKDKEIYDGIQKSKAAWRMARAMQFLTPGPNLTLAGDESANTTEFKYMFTDTPDGIKENVSPEQYKQLNKGKMDGYSNPLKVSEKIKLEKGYDASNPDLLEKFTIEGNPENKKLEQLFKDFSKIREGNPAITNRNTSSEFWNIGLNKDGGVGYIYRKNEEKNNEIFALVNLNKDKAYTGKDTYKMHEFNGRLPEGKWQLVMNTEDKKYAGSGLQNAEIIDVRKNNCPSVNLAPFSVLVYKKIGN